MIRKLHFTSFGLVGYFLCLSLVMEVLDLSLLDIFLSEHGSETRHGKRPEPRAMLCLLEYDFGANALG